jgi:hypothetical protein
MGCNCDAGYSNPDCSGRMCKYGIDPLYVDDEATARVTEVTFRVRDDAKSSCSLSGTYAIKFYDVFGEDYLTDPIEAAATATAAPCSGVVSALEGLPNTVIPSGSIVCSASTSQSEASVNCGVQYSLTFTGNPGVLKQIELDEYLDGARSTLTAGTAVELDVWQNGISGEFHDYWANRCDGVEVTGIENDPAGPTKVSELSSLSAAEAKLLKACLGDSNNDTTDNIEVMDWDYGSRTFNGSWSSGMGQYPHVVKLVASQSLTHDDYDAGTYYILWYHSSKDKFFLANKIAETGVAYHVYTTDGTAEVIFEDSDSDDVLDATERRVTARFNKHSNVLYTSFDTSCETTSNAEPCLAKGDHLFVVDAAWGNVTDSTSSDNTKNADPSQRTDIDGVAANTGNLFTVVKSWIEDYTSTTATLEDRYRIVLDRNLNWDSGSFTDAETEYGAVELVKFTPEPDSSGAYTYVSQCSNRGLCNGEDGLCECFKGYTNDNCDTQSALAV